MERINRHWRLLQGLLGLCILISGCSLEGSSDFTCGSPDDSLFETPPADTVYIKIESEDILFNKTFSGQRNIGEDENPVEGMYDNLFTYERSPSGTDRLFGLGTRITDDSDSTGAVITFNLPTGSELDEVCRSSKVFAREHDWSKWSQNIAGVEFILTLPVDGDYLTFSTDTSQEDDDIFTITGAEFLDELGFYARLGGSFTVKLRELGSASEIPLEVDISGTFILNMRVSR